MKEMTKNKARIIWLTQSAMIAAIYAALTLALSPISFGLYQVRIAEALCVLPLFTSSAIPGLFIGCIIANLVGGFGLLDIVLGSLATLLAAIAARLLKRKLLAPLPAVVFNAFAVGYIIYTVTPDVGYWIATGTIAVEQTLACYGLGLPLSFLLDRYKHQLFPSQSW